MQENESFEVLLDEKLNNFAKYMENRELPQLKDSFRIILASFQSIYNILMQKALIRSDPYKSDRKISDISTPSKAAFLESEKVDQISIRLSEYDSQLDFVNNYFNFSIETLSLDKIKKFIDLLNYFQWQRVIDTSADINTRVMAEMIGKVKLSTDNMAYKIINDNLGQIAQNVVKIQLVFKKLTIYYRETYKQSVNERIMFKLNIPEKTAVSNTDKVITLIKKNFPHEIPNTPYYPELIKEMLLEKYSAEKSELQSSVLKKLVIEEEKPKEKKEVSFKPVLLDAILSVAASGSHLEKALQKLGQNNVVLENRKKTVAERFRIWVMSVIRKKAEVKIIDLELFDEITGAKKLLKLNFQEFIDTNFRKTRLLLSLSNKMSTTFKKIQLAEEDYILDFLNRQIADLNLLLTHLPALDTYFKSESPKEERDKIRGIKLEITAIKNCVVRSNQKKHDYVAQQEEKEQMKKLGIDVS
ncbi:MAG: hypothetical protein JW874_01860 [Spirochaetales bacterium]|nr:hypothetical protein [Spirochaetales bacterium]